MPESDEIRARLKAKLANSKALGRLLFPVGSPAYVGFIHDDVMALVNYDQSTRNDETDENLPF